MPGNANSDATRKPAPGPDPPPTKTDESPTLAQLLYSGQSRTQGAPNVPTGVRRQHQVGLDGYGNDELLAQDGSHKHSVPSGLTSMKAVPIWENRETYGRPMENLGVVTQATTGQEFTLLCDALPLPNANYQQSGALSKDRLRSIGHQERPNIRHEVTPLDSTIDRTFDMVERSKNALRMDRAKIHAGLGRDGDLPGQTRMVDDTTSNFQCGYTDTRPYEEKVVLPGPTNRDETTRVSYTNNGLSRTPKARVATGTDPIERPDGYAPPVGSYQSRVDGTAPAPRAEPSGREAHGARVGGGATVAPTYMRGMQAVHQGDSTDSRAQSGYSLDGLEGPRQGSQHILGEIDRVVQSRQGATQVHGRVYEGDGPRAARRDGSADAYTSRLSSQSVVPTSTNMEAQRHMVGHSVETREKMGHGQVFGRTDVEAAQSYTGNDNSVHGRGNGGFVGNHHGKLGQDYRTPLRAGSYENAAVHLGAQSAAPVEHRGSNVMAGNTLKDAAFHGPRPGRQQDPSTLSRGDQSGDGPWRTFRSRTPRRTRQLAQELNTLPGVKISQEANSVRGGNVSGGLFPNSGADRALVSVR